MIMAKQLTTPEQKGEILALYETGKYLNHDIGKRYGLSAHSVHLIVMKLKKSKKTDGRTKCLQDPEQKQGSKTLQQEMNLKSALSQEQQQK